MMEINKNIINMSLDEIIARTKLSDDSAFSSSKRNNRIYTKFERRHNIYQKEEVEDILLKSEGVNEEAVTEIWKGPDATVAYIDCHDQKKDLREKLNREHMTRVSTIQYRLQHPNNSPDRPLGLPTLLPMRSGEPSRQRTTNYDNRPYRIRNRGYNNYFNKQNLNHTGNNRNGLDSSNNVRINRDGNQNSRKNTSITINNSGNFDDINGAQTERNARNLFIDVPSSSINLKSGVPIKSCFQVPKSMASMPIGGITPKAQAVLDLETGDKPVSHTDNGNLKTLLGFQGNISEEMMPLFASRLLEFVQNGAQANIHKPMYDMKLQREIHEIQNKPMLYKCNGGEVISSDGAGVNCKITPRTSGVSLNCRFA